MYTNQQQNMQKQSNFIAQTTKTENIWSGFMFFFFGEHKSPKADKSFTLFDSFQPSTIYTPPIVKAISNKNYRLTGEHFNNYGGAKTRFRNNINAIKLLYELEESGEPATKEQQNILARYIGWGGLAATFDEHNESWRNEYVELKGLLLGRDYTLARESTLSAFYTSRTVIDSIYEALRHMGFTGGTVLEPAMGTGNFIGLAPSDFNLKFHGVELDNITGKIARHLYPQANIQIKGFEKTKFPDAFFEAIITNVPFGSFKVYDAEYEKYNLFIHDYFILKSLDKLRAGGIAAIVTSKGTMDKYNSYARELFAQRAELIGAIRLPNNAFKDIAGTEVTSDILFFKKLEAIIGSPVDSWIDTQANEDGIEINKYFLDNPHMILGKMVKGKSMYGSNNETACVSDGRGLKAALLEAIKCLPPNIYTSITGTAVSVSMPKLLSTNPKHDALMQIKALVRHILSIQIQGCLDEELNKSQLQLNNLYDNFVLWHGCINHKTNRKIIREDNDYTLLLSLENYDEITDTATKADIFTKRTIKKYIRPTKADTALEALHICKNETGDVDLRIIQELTGKGFDDVITELDGLIYRNPVSDLANKYDGWETATEYLSGNVKQKLRIAKELAADHPEFETNALALSKVQPIPLTASEICVRIGTPWINTKFYRQFLIEKFKIYGDSLSVNFNKFTLAWKVEGGYDPVPRSVRGLDTFGIKNFQATNTYGTERVNGFRIFEYALNLQTPSVYDTTLDNDGKEKRVLNKPETIAAREKLRILQEEFKTWIFDEPNRRHELVEVYNDKFNNIVLAKYDGSYLDFPHMNPNIELKDYQKDAVERIITAGNTLLHHVVGAGKTFEIAAAAMKLRQLKLAQKPMIVVPNHLVLQWANEFRNLYPNAKLLIATKKDFEKENRLRFVSRIATNNWDAVVIAMSSFERLPISHERQARKIQEEIDAIEDALTDIKYDREKRSTVKDLQRVLKNKRAALESLSNGKKDDLIKFEELGVDYLFIDEAHKYKNKFIFTKMNNVAGISRAMSKRSTDLDMKIDYISELHGGQKGVVFATGTPISNSMVEMYTMQSYLAKDDLRDAGLMFFDDWAATFGETVTALELAPSGQGYRSKTRFAKFVNLPEMLKMYRKFADVKTADMLNLPVPKAIKRVITIKPTDEVLRLSEIITERAEAINAGIVRPEVDNMLKITSDGKKLALDPRCFDSAAVDDPANKVNVCVENVYRIWNDTKDARLTQLVFCDLSTPKCTFKDYVAALEKQDETAITLDNIYTNADGILTYAVKTVFDVYNHVKYNLVKLGVPAHEIAFIHDANTDTAKQILFDAVRAGKVRILLGSTEKCGAGTNVQNKLIAIHHLDTPYRPSDLEQREGRGIRQGNENAEIEIFTYVTERTFDAYSYQILENKQRFISQINRGDFSVREASDIDETTFSYAEIKAITSANPLIKRKNELEIELGNLRTLQNQYRVNRYALQDNVANALPKMIARLEEKVENYEKDISLRDANKIRALQDGILISCHSTPSLCHSEGVQSTTEESHFSITIANQSFTERKPAAELLHKYISNVNAGRKIASMYGFIITPELTENFLDKYVLIKGNSSYRLQISDSPLGTLTRIENFFKGMDDALVQTQTLLQSRQSELTSAIIELDKPFDHEQTILDLSSELGDIEAQLDLDKNEITPVIDDEDLNDTVDLKKCGGVAP